MIAGCLFVALGVATIVQCARGCISLPGVKRVAFLLAGIRLRIVTVMLTLAAASCCFFGDEDADLDIRHESVSGGLQPSGCPVGNGGADRMWLCPLTPAHAALLMKHWDSMGIGAVTLDLGAKGYIWNR